MPRIDKTLGKRRTRKSGWSRIFFSQGRCATRLRYAPTPVDLTADRFTRSPSYGYPNANFLSPDFGTIRTIVGAPRQMQFGMKFIF
jgi:hypothetical protein